MSPRPRAVSDAAVFAATARVISRDGPARLTVASVAQEAGLAASSLVERFGTKRGILLSFAAGGAAALRAVFAKARASHAKPKAALEAALLELASSVRSRKALAHHLAFLQMDLSDEAFREHAVAHGDAFREETARLLRDAGETSSAAAERARDIQVGYNGALVTWAIHGEGTVGDAIRRALAMTLRVLLAALVLHTPMAVAQTQEPAAVKPQHQPPVIEDSVLAAEEAASAPERPNCWRAQPLPSCSGFFVTDFGFEGAVLSSSSRNRSGQHKDFTFRATWGVGFMGTSGRNSHGAVIALSTENIEHNGAAWMLEYRFRRWVSGVAAVDVGGGYKTNAVRDSVGGVIPARGITSMVAFTPNRWIGASLRFEQVHARGRAHRGVFLGLQSTRASEFMIRGVALAAVHALLGAIGVEWEEED